MSINKLLVHAFIVLLLIVPNVLWGQISVLDFETSMKDSFTSAEDNKCLPENVAFFTAVPLKEDPYSIDKDSSIFVEIQRRMKQYLAEKLVPDTAFIAKSTRLYRLKAGSHIIGTEKQITGKGSQIIDTTFTLYHCNGMDILIVCNSNDYNATMIFFKKKNQDPKDFLSKKVLGLYDNKKHKKINNSPEKPTDSDFKPLNKTYNDSGSPNMPDTSELLKIFDCPDTFCLVGPKFFPQDIPCDLIIFPHEWFTLIKNIDVSDREVRTKIQELETITHKRETQCKEWITTEAGRVKLLELLASKENEKVFEFGTEFDKQRYQRKFQELPLATLKDYYRSYKDAQAEKAARYSAWKYDKITPPEAETLRKLLESDDLQVKCDALCLIQAGNGRCLVPDVLKLSNDKEQVTKEMTGMIDLFSDEPRDYHFFVYELLGWLGDAQTLKVLEKRYKKGGDSDLVKADIELAMDSIKKNLAEAKRLRAYVYAQRQLIRDHKLVVSDDNPLSIDIDKPDPEPVTAKGFRRWETTDGLFKTTAKFVAIKEIGNGKEDDVRLLRHDGKEVTIEYSALRKIDHEYIRQQLEPLRNWSTADGSIKAKLLGKFDTEIILEEPDGITTFIEIDKLSEEDKEYLKRVPVSPHSKYVF